MEYALTTSGLIPIQAVSNGMYGYHEEGMQLEKNKVGGRSQAVSPESLGDFLSIRGLKTFQSFRTFGVVGNFSTLCRRLLLLLLLVVVLVLLFLVVLALLLGGGFGH